MGGIGLTFLGILLFLSSLFMILLILVQRGKGGGLTGALGGMGGQSAFGAKAGDVFTRITVITAIVWITLCMITIAAYNPPPREALKPADSGPSMVSTDDEVNDGADSGSDGQGGDSVSPEDLDAELEEALSGQAPSDSGSDIPGNSADGAKPASSDTNDDNGAANPQEPQSDSSGADAETGGNPELPGAPKTGDLEKNG